MSRDRDAVAEFRMIEQETGNRRLFARPDIADDKQPSRSVGLDFGQRLQQKWQSLLVTQFATETQDHFVRVQPKVNS